VVKMVVELTEPAHFWTNPEGIKLACYEWLPKNKTPKFIVYICEYRDRECSIEVICFQQLVIPNIQVHTTAW